MEIDGRASKISALKSSAEIREILIGSAFRTAAFAIDSMHNGSILRAMTMLIAVGDMWCIVSQLMQPAVFSFCGAVLSLFSDFL